ncbi:MAG TPA: hypothetical protein PKY82_29800 [Pyrinomonadaceae bacterium]|nr:hypothetical protein [Pyrinomonadaceae bacterium]
MEIKPPKFKRTFEFIHRLAGFVGYGVIAQKSGKELQTAEAWGRAPESVEHPNGTGKRNPFDGVLRLIALAHEKDPGLAGEIAEIFSDYVNFLNEFKAGEFIKSGNSIYQLLGESTKEHTDVVCEALKAENPDWEKVYTEFKQGEAKFMELGAVIKEKLKI